jgi:methyl-accepting chemotaxis protein
MVLLFLMVRGINDNIAFAKAELRGNDYQRPLMDLLLNLPLHQIAARAQDKSALAAATARVDQAFSKLEAAQVKHGEFLGFTPAELAKRKRDHVQLANVMRRWSEIKGSAWAATADGDRHAQLVADVRTLITHAGDLSNLILDPDLDSYYLMDVTLLALPQLQDRLAATMLLGSEVLVRGSITPQERVQFAVAVAMLTEADLGRTLASLETALNEDANFYGMSPTLATTLKPKATKLGAAAGEFIALVKKLAAEENPAVEAAAFLAAGHRARETVQSTWTAASAELDVLLQSRIDYFAARRTTQIGVTGAVLLGSILLVVAIGRSITRPLRRIMGALTSNSEQLGEAVGRWSISSHELAAGASEQAESLEETSASLEEMAIMTKHTASNAQSAKELGKTTRHAAEAGATEMSSMSDAMVEIKAASDNIAKIIRSIDEIAFQTSLLALNAAVEAARAGEAGTGFAVVADEVRNLAQRCAVSAKETAAKIEDSIQKTERGAQICFRVNTSLQDIVTKAREMDQLIAEIAIATSEQNTGIAQINTAVTQMDSVTQNAAATASSIASSAEQLNGQASELSEAVLDLNRIVEGRDSSPVSELNPHRSLAYVGKGATGLKKETPGGRNLTGQLRRIRTGPVDRIRIGMDGSRTGPRR